MTAQSPPDIPKEIRHRTDTLCLHFSWPIFVLTLLLFILVCINGAQYSFLHPPDSKGMRCGLNNTLFSEKSPDFTQKPYLTAVKGKPVCTDECNGTIFLSNCIPRDLKKAPKSFIIQSDFLKAIVPSILIIFVANLLAFPLYFIISKIASKIFMVLVSIVILLIGLVFIWSIKQSYFTLTFSCMLFVTLLLFFINFMRRQFQYTLPIFSFSFRVIFRSHPLFAVPLVLSLIAVAALFFIFIGVSFSSGVADPEYDDASNTLNLIQHSSLKTAPFLFTLIGLWVIIFSLHLVATTVAYMTSSYYYQISVPPFTSSLSLISAYHTGTIFFGSFVILMFEGFSALFVFLQEQVEKTENSFVKFVCQTILTVCFLLVRLTESINRISFVYTAMEGLSFWEGCSESRKALSVYSVSSFNRIINSLFLFSRLIITIGASIVSFFVFSNREIEYLWLYVGLVALFNFLSLMNVEVIINAACRTTLVCVWEDALNYDGKKYYGPTDLHPIVALFTQEPDASQLINV